MREKLLRLLSSFRLTPHDTASPEGRTAERYRLAAWSALSNALSKGLAVLVLILSVTLTLPYLGAERFGAWMTISGLAAMLSFLDLGVGNALTNHIARANSLDDTAALRSAISGGVGLLALLGSVSAVVLALVANQLPWGQWLRMQNPAFGEEARSTAVLFGALFGLNLFSTGLQRIYAGMQRGYLAHAASAIGSALALLGLAFAAQSQANLPTLLLATFGVQSCAGLALLFLLIRERLASAVALRHNIRTHGRTLLQQGGLFFALQIGTMAATGADGLIVATTLGAAQAAVFVVAQRLFQIASQPLAIANAPLWAAYADAHARNDTAFVRSTLKRSMSASVAVAAAISLTLVFANDWLIAAWTKGSVTVPAALILAFAIWTIFEIGGNAFAMFLNGCNIVKPQVIVVGCYVLVMLPLKIFGVITLGMSAIPLAAAASYLCVVILLYATVFRADIQKVL
jgi:O-antigen/teichoic acid export membrane protein